jgi:hypothetical protein
VYMLDPAGELTLLLLVPKTADSSRAQLAENREQCRNTCAWVQPSCCRMVKPLDCVRYRTEQVPHPV